MYISWRLSYLLKNKERIYCILLFYRSWLSCYDIHHYWNSLVALVTYRYDYHYFWTNSHVFCDKKVSFKLLTNQYFMNIPNTLRFIVTSLVTIFNIEQFLYCLSLPLCRLMICLRRHIILIIFVSWLKNSRYFLLMHHEFDGTY